MLHGVYLDVHLGCIIRPITGTWYIDRNAWLAQLQTHRKQLPLLPGFACTANAAQGGNWSAAITDINIAGGMSPQAAYVSLSRVREKKAIWILRPFPRHRFSKPARRGPDLLLKQLRGETVDWDTVAEEFGKNRKDDKSTGTPHLHCGKCGRLSPCENFTLEELMQGAARRCVACLGGQTCDRATGSGICQACAGLRPCLQCCCWRLPSNFNGLALTATQHAERWPAAGALSGSRCCTSGAVPLDRKAICRLARGVGATHVGRRKRKDNGAVTLWLQAQSKEAVTVVFQRPKRARTGSK